MGREATTGIRWGGDAFRLSRVLSPCPIAGLGGGPCLSGLGPGKYAAWRHHCSALTLSAGLDGRGNPECPLQGLIDPSQHTVSTLHICEHETDCVDNEALYDLHFRTLKLTTPS